MRVRAPGAALLAAALLAVGCGHYGPPTRARPVDAGELEAAGRAAVEEECEEPERREEAAP